jgi:hypothetical protein
MLPYVQLLTDHSEIALSIALLIVFLYTIYLHIKIQRFTKGEKGSSLEGIIRANIENAEKIEKTNEIILKHLELLDSKVTNSVRSAKIVRYKAFESHGSNQSFSLALLDEEGNGVVLTSLHAHDRINTFAKPVEDYKSTYELTEEELNVIDECKKEHGNS